MEFRDRVVLDAQAEGLACVYCGRSCRDEGSLAPLRAESRQGRRPHVPGGFLVIGGSSSAARVIRCDPPCRPGLGPLTRR